jgi:hypothetical protein
MEKVIIKPNANMFIASSSSLGNTIASEYRPWTIVPNIDVIAMNNANTPKSSGAYNLVSIGEIAIGIA